MISGVMDFAIDLGGKFLNGLTSFIDIGYKAYDWTRGAIKTIGGDTLVKEFDKFMGVIDFVINALLLATFARGFGRDLPGRNRGKGNRGPGGRTRRGRVPITRTGGSATPRGRLGRMFGPIANKFRFNPFSGARVTQSGGVRNPFRARPNVTKGGGFKNPLRARPNVTGGTPKGRFKLPKIPGLKNLKGGQGNAILNAILAPFEFIGRKGAGQTNLQAGVGTAGSTAGGMAGFAAGGKAGAALGATIGAFFAGVGAVPGAAIGGAIGSFLGGIGGGMLGGAAADTITGAKGYNEGGKVRKPKKLKKKSSRTLSKGIQKSKLSTRTLVKKSNPVPSAPTVKPPTSEEVQNPEKQRAWWDFLGWAGTGGGKTDRPLGVAGQEIGERVSKVGNTLGENQYFGSILKATSKIILNKKLDDSDYSAVGDSINALIYDGIRKERIARGLKGFSSGGRIDGQLSNIYVGDWVAETFKRTVSDNIAQSYAVTTSKKPLDTSSSTPTPGAGTSSGKISGSVYGSTEMKALLDVLAYAEGTSTNRNGATGPAGYSTWAGYQMHGPSDLTGLTIQEVHDLQTSFINSGKVNKTGSAVVGKYQFKDLLEHYAPQAGLSGGDIFSPENQDKMAIAEIQRVGITTDKLKNSGLTQSTLDTLAPIWASMPYSPKDGASYYGGQPSKPASELINLYKERASFIMNKKKTSTPNLEPSDTISAGTGGEMVRSEKGTKLAGELGRYIYKHLTPAAKATDGVGDFSYASEHPDFGGSFKRSYPSWHNVDRAIDIGGYWPKDQKKILAKIMEFNKKFGVQPVELLYGKPGTPKAGTHADHVHVAYEKGGVTLGKPHLALMGEKGHELVIDTDSMGPAKDMLLAINQASGKQGVLKAIADYAPYESIEGSTVVINKQTIMSQMSGMQGSSPVIVRGGRKTENFSEFLENQG